MIFLFWEDLSDDCGETNFDSMQNGAITFIFINKETISFSLLFFLHMICLFLQPATEAKMLCGLCE